MSQLLTDPNRPLTVSVLRAALELLEGAGHGDAPISLYADGNPSHLIQAHNVVPDTSAADRRSDPKLGFCSAWDTCEQTGSITNFVIL